jgi:type IV secretory pathway VirB6-like protein
MNKYYKYIPVVLTLALILYIILSGYEFDTSPTYRYTGGGSINGDFVLFAALVFGVIYTLLIIKELMFGSHNKKSE